MDHVSEYRRPKDEDGKEIIEKGCAPKIPTPTPSPPVSDDESETAIAANSHKRKKKKKHKQTVKSKPSEREVNDSLKKTLIRHDSPSHRPGYFTKKEERRRFADELSKLPKGNQSPLQSKGRERSEVVDNKYSGDRYRYRSRSRSRERGTHHRKYK